MSKIYEALLRAELDRLSPEEQQQYAEDPENFPRIHALVGRAQVRVAEMSEPQANWLPQARTATPLALDDVPVRRWQPNLEKLPTLQTRAASAEQFRSLRSRLYEYRGLNKLKTVLVSSGVPQEGKTFVAANLAMSLARYKNNKILLIDADLRRNSLHKLLGCSASPGLSTYLTGEASATEVMQRSDMMTGGDASQPAALANLTFIAGGNAGDSAADLSSNSRFKDLLKFAEPHFDWIVVDSSPVNVVSDAVNLGTACDGVLLVVRGGGTRYQTAQRAQKEFVASNLLGVVLNGVTEAPAQQGYYGYDSETE